MRSRDLSIILKLASPPRHVGKSGLVIGACYSVRPKHHVEHPTAALVLEGDDTGSANILRTASYF